MPIKLHAIVRWGWIFITFWRLSITNISIILFTICATIIRIVVFVITNLSWLNYSVSTNRTMIFNTDRWLLRACVRILYNTTWTASISWIIVFIITLLLTNNNSISAFCSTCFSNWPIASLCTFCTRCTGTCRASSWARLTSFSFRVKFTSLTLFRWEVTLFAKSMGVHVKVFRTNTGLNWGIINSVKSTFSAYTTNNNLISSAFNLTEISHSYITWNTLAFSLNNNFIYRTYIAISWSIN